MYLVLIVLTVISITDAALDTVFDAGQIVDTADKSFEQPITGDTHWQTLKVKCKDASVTGKTLFVVDLDGGLYCLKIQSGKNSSWTRILGDFDSIAATPDLVYAIKNQTVYTSKRACDGQWEKLEGQLLTQIVPRSSDLLGISSSGEVVQGVSNGSNYTWKSISTPGIVFKHLSADDTVAFAVVAKDDTIYRWNGQSWTKINGMVDTLHVATGAVWGVNRARNVYACDLPCSTGAWKQVPGPIGAFVAHYGKAPIGIGMDSFLVVGDQSVDPRYTRY